MKKQQPKEENENEGVAAAAAAASNDDTTMKHSHPDDAGFVNANTFDINNMGSHFFSPSTNCRLKLGAKLFFIIGVSLMLGSSLIMEGGQHMDASAAMSLPLRSFASKREASGFAISEMAGGDHQPQQASVNENKKSRRQMVESLSCSVQSAAGTFQETVDDLRKLIARNNGFVTRESSNRRPFLLFGGYFFEFTDDNFRTSQWIRAVRALPQHMTDVLRSIFPVNYQGSGIIQAKIPSEKLDTFLQSLMFGAGGQQQQQKKTYTIHDIQRSSRELPATVITSTETLLEIATSELQQFQKLYDTLTTAKEKMDLLPQLMEREREVRRFERRKSSLEKIVDYATVSISVSENSLSIPQVLPQPLHDVWEHFYGHRKWSLQSLGSFFFDTYRPNAAVWVGDFLKVLAVAQAFVVCIFYIPRRTLRSNAMHC